MSGRDPCQDDLSLWIWPWAAAQAVPIRVLHLEVALFFPLPTLCTSESGDCAQPTLKECGCCALPPWGWRGCVSCWELFCTGLPLLPHFFLYTSMDSGIFILHFRFNPVLLFLLRLVQLWPLGALSFGSCAPFTFSHHCGVLGGFVLFLTALPDFLVPQGSPYLSWVFPAPHLESAISPRVLFFFTRDWNNFVVLPNDLNEPQIPRFLLFESDTSKPQQRLLHTEWTMFTIKGGTTFSGACQPQEMLWALLC